MKTVIVSLIIFLSVAIYAGDWQEIKINQSKVDLIRKGSGADIFYASGSELHLVNSGVDRMLSDFSLPITGMYVEESDIIVTLDNENGVYRDSLAYLYDIKSGESRLLVLPKFYDRWGVRSYSQRIADLIEWKNEPVLIIQAGFPIYWVQTIFLQVRPDRLDTLFILDGKQELVSYFRISNVVSFDDKILLSGFQNHPSPNGIFQEIACTWNPEKKSFDVIRGKNNSREGPWVYVVNDSTTYLFESYLINDLMQVGISKTIRSEKGDYIYYKHNDEFYYEWSTFPEKTTGCDFFPLAGLRIGDKILFVGPVAKDTNNNLTSVRSFDLSKSIFKNEGEGLDGITAIFYEQIEGRFCIYLGSYGKIYYREITNLTSSVNTETECLRYGLSQNYPNPFNPATTIKYSVPESDWVNLSVYDLLGKEVVNLVNEKKEAGVHSAVFNSNNLSSGVYLYKIRAGTFITSKKMIVIK